MLIIRGTLRDEVVVELGAEAETALDVEVEVVLGELDAESDGPCDVDVGADVFDAEIIDDVAAEVGNVRITVVGTELSTPDKKGVDRELEMKLEDGTFGVTVLVYSKDIDTVSIFIVVSVVKCEVENGYVSDVVTTVGTSSGTTITVEITVV